METWRLGNLDLSILLMIGSLPSNDPELTTGPGQNSRGDPGLPMLYPQGPMPGGSAGQPVVTDGIVATGSNAALKQRGGQVARHEQEEQPDGKRCQPDEEGGPFFQPPVIRPDEQQYRRVEDYARKRQERPTIEMQTEKSRTEARIAGLHMQQNLAERDAGADDRADQENPVVGRRGAESDIQQEATTRRYKCAAL